MAHAAEAVVQQNSPTSDELKTKLNDKTAKLAVIGLGYVGIPLVSAFCGKQFNVTGYDVDDVRVQNLNDGVSPIKHIPSEEVKEIVDAGIFKASSSFEGLADADAIIICVPTPLTKQREPDLSYVVETTKTISKYLRRGQIVTLESTTYPGTTVEIMRPILEAASGLKSGEDFFLAYSPEREDPGNSGFNASNTPKVVGGDGAIATEIAQLMYQQIVDVVVPVSSPETAEAVKLTENIFRAVNIALVNELKVIYSEMGIDVWEVIDAAKTKPFGFMPFYPGPGLGGHCIPIDPFYLTWKAKEFDIHTRFIELAGEMNNSMINYVVDGLADALNHSAEKSLKGSNILMLGIAYKKNVDDMRESPALKVWERLQSKGANVDYHDPFIASFPKTRHYPSLEGCKSVPLDVETLKKYDAVFVATDHDDVDYQLIADQVPLIVDSRNAFERHGVSGEHIIKT